MHAREARKKSSALLGRIQPLRGPWMTFINAKESDPERDAKLLRFEQALLRHPEAYLTYAHATSLIMFDEALRAELARREMPLTKKKARQDRTQQAVSSSAPNLYEEASQQAGQVLKAPVADALELLDLV